MPYVGNYRRLEHFFVSIIKKTNGVRPHEKFSDLLKARLPAFGIITVCTFAVKLILMHFENTTEH
jgi:hypothetical protein